VLSAAAIAFMLQRLPAGAGLDAEARWVWLPAILGAAVLVSVALALWLDYKIIRHLSGLARGLSEGQVSELRGLPSTSGWGELSELTLRTEATLARHRQLARAGSELVRLRDRLANMHESLQRWAQVGTWEPLIAGNAGEVGTAALAPLVSLLNRELSRISNATAAGRETSIVLKRETSAALDEVRDVAEQSERGFVEATALLTTVRELDRLSVELETALAVPARVSEDGTRAAREALERYGVVAAGAIDQLVSASTDSVVHLANGMQRMQEVTDQTHVIANRATLIALHAITGKTVAEPGSALADELKSLAREVREASDRVGELTTSIQSEAALASERMKAVRAEVAAALEAAPRLEPVEAGEPMADSQRLMERVREMIRDAAAKGERLSSAGERVSRAAEQLRRRIEGETEIVAQLASTLRGRPPGAGGAEEPSAVAYLKMLELSEEAEEPSAEELAADEPAAPDRPGEASPDREERA